MAQQTVSIGSSANDGTGDPLRTAFTKINTNFTELYGTTAEANDVIEDTSPQLGGNLDINGWNITSARTNENIRIIPAGTGTIELEKNVNVTGNLTATGNIIANGNINLGDGSGDQVKVTGVFEADQLQIDGTTMTSTVTNGDVTISGNGTGQVQINKLTIDSAITIDNGTISTILSNADLELQTAGTGNIVLNALTINGTTLSSADSTKITIAETLDVTGATSLGSTLGVTGTLTTADITTTGTHTITGTLVADGLTIKDNAITSGSNSDIEITPGGTGNVVAGAVTINGTTLSSTDSTKITVAEALDVTGAATVVGTLTTADVTTVGTHTVTGQTDVDYVKIKDHAITTNASNANLDVSANGTGVVNVASAMTTIGQTVTGDVAITGRIDVDNVAINGNGIAATNSNGAININPNGSGIITMGGSYVHIPNRLVAGDAWFDYGIAIGPTGNISQQDTNVDLILATNGTGTIRINNAQTQSSVGAVGAASKLPLDSANEIRPVGYLKLSLDGTTYAVPYFNAS